MGRQISHHKVRLKSSFIKWWSTGQCLKGGGMCKILRKNLVSKCIFTASWCVVLKTLLIDSYCRKVMCACVLCIIGSSSGLSAGRGGSVNWTKISVICLHNKANVLIYFHRKKKQKRSWVWFLKVLRSTVQFTTGFSLKKSHTFSL